MSDSQVIGLVTFARHGDRSGFYQNPESYAATGTVISPLGLEQTFGLGQHLRDVYLTESSPSAIASLASATLFNQNNFNFLADAGGEGGVIFDSAVATAQGMFPPTASYNTTLANGTNVVSPLGGYQYIPIASINPNEDVSLEPWTSCNTFTEWTTQTYDSEAFQQTAQEVQPMLEALSPLLGGRNASLENGYNIFDFVNVQSIHNPTFLAETTPELLEEARYIGNYHEQILFSAPNASSIGNIAFNAMSPDVLSALKTSSNTTAPLRWTHIHISYKPFISFFNLVDVASLTGIVDYASYVALELRQDGAGDQFVRMNFRNGSQGDATTYPMFGNSGDTPLSQFQDKIGSTAITSLGQWCNVCNQTSLRGCDVVTAANASLVESGASPSLASGSAQASLPAAAEAHCDALTLADAGAIGAGVTLGLVLILLIVLAIKGYIGLGKRYRNVNNRRSNVSDDYGSVKSYNSQMPMRTRF